MVDQKLKDFSPSPYADDHSLPTLADITKIYRNGGLRDYLQKEFSFELYEDKDNTKTYEKLESWKIQEALSNFSLDLLNRVESETESVSLQKEIYNIENAYKYVMERFLQKMEQFLSSCRELRAELQDAGVKFHAASRVTAEVTLVSSTIEMALLLGNAARKLLHLEWNPKFLFYETLAGSVSVATALIALSYMKWSSAKIMRDVSEETHFLVDIVFLYRKGNWIDEDVVNLFPHGIDLTLLEEDDSSNRIFQCLGSWRHKLCYAIILTNTQKDAKLLVDENFLRRVKMFVRSQAAEIWWNRKKIKKLLDKIVKKVEATSVKEITADHDIHYKRIALYLYPVMTPLLLNSINSGKMKFLCSSFLIIRATYDLTTNEHDECEGLKKVLSNFEADFSEIKEICQSLDNEDD